MDFHLFAKKKDSEEIKQAQDVKSATQENSNTAPPAFQNEFNNIDTNNMDETQDTFNNPFSNNQSENQDLNSQNNNNSNNTSTQKNPFENTMPMENNNNNSIPNTPNMNQNTQMQQPQVNENQDFENLENNNRTSYSKEEVQEIIDETVEKVIEERWGQIVAKVDKVVSWKDKQESQINLIKEDVLTMKEGVEKLEKRLIGKIESYDKNILDVNSEIKALEKVFQKITPTLVNNVNELSKITRGLKESKNNPYDDKRNQDKDIE